MGSTQRRPQNSERAVNIESEYDYGSKNGIWRLFRLFNKKTFKYTLCCRKAIEDDPDVGISSVNRHDVASHAYRWIDYAHMTPEKEKAYIKKEIETVQRLGVLLQSGGIMTSIKPISVFDLGILQDMDIPLLWDSGSYADDLAYWVDVPAEKSDEKPRMLMIPCYYGTSSSIENHAPNLTLYSLQWLQIQCSHRIWVPNTLLRP